MLYLWLDGALKKSLVQGLANTYMLLTNTRIFSREMERPVSLERTLAFLQLSASTIVLSPCIDRKTEKQVWKALVYKLASHVSTLIK